ncbi:MAG: hypothetical protein AAF799_41365 [Myxococcota bacterium]
MRNTRLTLWLAAATLCGGACISSDGDGEADTDASPAATTSTGSTTASEPSGSSEAATSSGPGSSGEASTRGTDPGTDDSSGSLDESSGTTEGATGCSFPDEVFLTGLMTDGWAYLCYDPDTEACGLVQGEFEEIDPCGEISGTPALQFFHAIGLGDLSIRAEPDSINAWELLTTTQGDLSPEIIDELPFDTPMVVTLRPVGTDVTYELSINFGFMGAALAQIESFEVVR